MTLRREPAALALLLIATLAGRRGQAAEPEARSPRTGLRLDLSIGFAALDTLSVPPGTPNDNIGSGAPIIGCALDGRIGPVVVGASADVAPTFNQSERFLGVHAGYAQDRGSEELDVIPEVGAHFVTGLGRGFLTESDSPSATLPYAGLRVGMLHRRGTAGLGLGFWLFMRADLAHRTVVAHTTAFTDHTDIAYDVGGMMFGAAFRAQIGR
jgi:hypothetical protein